MKALILKDLLYFRQQGKMLLVLTVFYIVFFLSTQGGTDSSASMVMVLTVMITMILMVTSFSLDESTGWDSYARAFPVTKDQIVAAKYVLTFLLALVGGIFAFAVTVGVKWNITVEDGVSLYAALAIVLVLNSIFLPLLYRFGVQKARILLIGVVLLPTMAAVLLKNVGISGPTDGDIILWLRLSPIFVLALFCASFLISCRIYRKKEG